MSRNIECVAPAIGMTRIVPACSTMNSRRVPSRAPVTNTGLASPVATGMSWICASALPEWRTPVISAREIDRRARTLLKAGPIERHTHQLGNRFALTVDPRNDGSFPREIDDEPGLEPQRAAAVADKLVG